MPTMDAATRAQRLQQERMAVEAALTRIAARVEGDGPVSAALRYALQGGGKRLRPVLCVAAFDSVSGVATRRTALYDAAASLELIHTYSLVHDDLPCMDDDDLRRNRATTHRQYGTAAAMLAGCTLVPLACTTLADAAEELGCTPADVAAAVRELCRAAGAGGMVGGQVLDLEAEGRALPLAELRRLHTLKTGALFAGSLHIGAILAGANAHTRDLLGDFGIRLGLAFQITDDVLDVTMDASALGKTPGKDVQAAKATFVSLLGIAEAKESARREARAAVDVLRSSGVESALLEAVAEFAVDRDR